MTPQEEVQTTEPSKTRYLYIFPSKTVFVLCVYLLLLAFGIVTAWLQVLGILPILILTATIFGFMHLGYSLVLSDSDDHLDHLDEERGGRRKKVVFFIDN